MVAALRLIEDRVGKYFIWVDASPTETELASIYYIGKYLLPPGFTLCNETGDSASSAAVVKQLQFFFIFHSYNENIATNTLNLLDEIHYEK